MNKIARETTLIVAAHPDDEILGMGGTLLKLAQSGQNNLHLLFLSFGEASRGKKETNEDLRKQQAIAVSKKIGARLHLEENFPDNAFDSVPLLKIIQKVEYYLNIIKPTIIYTHHGQDLNVDHRLTFQAVFTAVRPSRYPYLKKLYTFEILSSTEWQVKTSSTVFLPNTYVDIERYLEPKIELLKEYQRELSPYPFPRSVQGVKALAQYRGMESGLKYAEAFQLIREVRP
ncbi:PIG-L family deacetylase [Candidatus Collierbacteria bacterium]|nr:PIG-L family deacetylase [Candidatus Collierbacteria bacterium]